MGQDLTEKKLKLAVLQRVCPSYRVSLFAGLSVSRDLDMTLFIGDDVPKTKVKSAKDLTSVNHRRLNTRFFKVFGRLLVWQGPLISELKKMRPDVILCEAESHFLGYLQAILYKLLVNRKVKLIHWCYIELPGTPDERSLFHGSVKRFTRSFFDAFVVYSTFSEKALLKRGVEESRIFPSINVGDTKKFLQLGSDTLETSAQAKQQLNLPDRFKQTS